MNEKTMQLVDLMIKDLSAAKNNLLDFKDGNKSAGRRARKLLDKIAKDKVALRKAMMEG